jgi:hypothetical protein
MDPLEKCHEHVHSLLFQHLSVPEIRELSLVSRKWYKAIGKCNEAMQKLWLNVGDRYNEPKKFDLKVFRVLGITSKISIWARIGPERTQISPNQPKKGPNQPKPAQTGHKDLC